MAINFIPNDPNANDVPMRVASPRPDRPANRAGYAFSGAVPEKVYDPATEPAEFLFWQCREAALASLETWETVTGASFTSWQPGKKIKLLPNAGEEANAFYDRDSLSFFEFTTGGKVFFSGASTDVVAHEAGHGILDAIRPTLILSSMFEVNAFHEAFGDCIAILTALHDDETRKTVLADLKKKNFVEGTAENLSACIKLGIANGDIAKRAINASAPRRARNDHKWQLPSTLPEVGSTSDGVGVLINEAHCFGQLFSGCFYDSIVNIFDRLGGSTEAQLLTAARTAGLILSKAVAVAPEKARFFREVGRSMIKVDQDLNGGANGAQITSAFEGHNIPLGTGAMFQPVAKLSGAAPKIAAAAATLGSTAKKDLLSRIDGGGSVVLKALRLGGEAVANFIHERRVDCGGIDKRLKGVVALAAESVLVGDSGGRAAVLGALTDPAGTIDEVETFVRSLLKKGAIDFGGKTKGAVAGAGSSGATHRIETINGKKTLVRFRYSCQCHGRAI